MPLLRSMIDRVEVDALELEGIVVGSGLVLLAVVSAEDTVYSGGRWILTPQR